MTSKQRTTRREILVNVDTVEFEISGMDFQQCTKVEATVTDTDTGEIRFKYGNRVKIGKNGTHNLVARTLNWAKTLRLSGSPYASHYGQNLFTHSDVQRACRLAIKKAVRAFDLHPPAEILEGWLAGDHPLNKLDIAVNFALSSEEDVMGVLQHLRRHFGELAVTTKTNRTSFYYAPRDGKEYEIAFYAKGAQVRQARCYRKAPFREQLVAESKCILRVEVRLRRKELAKLGLQKASAWQPDTAARIFSQYMAKLKLKNATAGPMIDDELAVLPNRLKHVFAVHKAGYNLTTIYGERTLQRHLSDFRRLKLDLRCPNQPAGAKVSLLKFVSPRRVINQVPAWMYKLGIAPRPRKKRTGEKVVKGRR